LRKWGVISSPILFLADPLLARISVCFTGAWKSFPFMMIVLLSGMQGIPDELYESAAIDGAGFFRSFRYITVPMLKNVSIIATVLMFIWTFNNFENIYLLTKGGPANATFVLPILSYYTAFFRSQLGYASAISTLMLVVLLGMALIYMRILQKIK
ncbi:MAG: sugar ABC transporter permease, partial [Treponema sp.]|jgi:multiple sugar transport system permease protein|nr:sugar ABC transporter permease [Treponema sp.]